MCQICDKCTKLCTNVEDNDWIRKTKTLTNCNYLDLNKLQIFAFYKNLHQKHPKNAPLLPQIQRPPNLQSAL